VKFVCIHFIIILPFSHTVVIYIKIIYRCSEAEFKSQWKVSVTYPGMIFGDSTISVEDRRQREQGSGNDRAPSQGFRSICKWVKPVLWLRCYRFIFHGTGNSAQLWQNFGISSKISKFREGLNHQTPPSRYATERFKNCCTMLQTQKFDKLWTRWYITVPGEMCRTGEDWFVYSNLK
jgi:hypothetical protein